MSASHPCLRCGACCAHFRASFYWAEADDATPEGVPVSMTRKLTPHLRVMRGTEGTTPRCVALMGTIGDAVRCTIHPRRSTVCRDFPPSFEDGVGAHNPGCDAARAAWGLPPLTPEDWDAPAPTGAPEVPPLPQVAQAS
ncbi:MAG: YkgJ family cysteine cluster protein [Algiphilus sp.]